MFRLWVENEKGEKLELTNSPYCEVLAITGLLPEKADIKTTPYSAGDGSELNNATVKDKPISIDIKPNFPIGENRQKLYNYFRLKRKCTVFFENENRNVKISGIVEGYDGSLFEQMQIITVYIICLEPHFLDKKETNVNMSTVKNMFQFPFAIAKEGIAFSTIDKELTQIICNKGDVETGVMIELSASGEVTNPVIYNVDTKDFFGLNITMQTGDVIKINTNRFKKKVELFRNGEIKNIINNIKKGNKWLVLQTGKNQFTYKCDSGEENLNIKFSFYNKYVGV